MEILKENVLKEYIRIIRYIHKNSRNGKNDETYGLSYNYNKDTNAIEYYNEDYYSSNNEGNIAKRVTLNEEEYNSLVELLQTKGYKVTHHYIYIDKDERKRKKK